MLSQSRLSSVDRGIIKWFERKDKVLVYW